MARAKVEMISSEEEKMARVKVEMISSEEEEDAEDWCFECKDGGQLIICDYKGCLKSYHPRCVGKKESFFKSDKSWICRRHKCLVCRKKDPNYYCYCCVRAVCSRCIGRIGFVVIKRNYGFCNNCLKIAVLVEKDLNVDSDGESVDLKDRETYEGLFREYYEIIKENEGLNKSCILAAKVRMDKESAFVISSDSGDVPFEEKDGESALDEREAHKQGLRKKRRRRQKEKMGALRISSNSEKDGESALKKKSEQNTVSSILFSTAGRSEFAAVIPKNINLVYLKKSLLLEIIKQPQSVENKLIGSFVRVKLNPHGVKLGSSDKYDSEISLQVSDMPGDVCLSSLSDTDFSQEECENLREKVKAGLLKKLTVVELEQKVKLLHEDIVKHRIAQEVHKLQILIDVSNEKGRRPQLYDHLERKKLIQHPGYLAFQLDNIPLVIADEKDGGQMHQCSEETTTTKVVPCEQEDGASCSRS